MMQFFIFAVAFASLRETSDVHKKHHEKRSANLVWHKHGTKTKHTHKMWTMVGGCKGKKEPGAGMDSTLGLKKVYKDGYFHLRCMMDKMEDAADWHDELQREHKYNIDTNVTIVRYTDRVDSEKQQAMTPSVCFEFCRTVPDMLHFGLTNGRDCYCTPYFDAMESDSSECDSTCEGSPTQMCGGKVKSSLFGMHSCMNKGEKLGDISGKVEDVMDDLEDELSSLTSVAGNLQGVGSMIQEIAGEFGDPAASNLMQESKVFAGEVEKFIKDNTKVAGDMKKAMLAAGAMKGKDLTKFENADKADEALKTLMEEVDKAEEATEKIDAIGKLALPENEDTKGKAELYRPVMYFAATRRW